jgi:hypothetical protein
MLLEEWENDLKRFERRLTIKWGVMLVTWIGVLLALKKLGLR